jgi:hypothetical protein
MDLTGNTGNAGIVSDGFATTIGQTYMVSFNAMNGSTVYPGAPYFGPAFSLQANGGGLVAYSGAADVPPGVPTTLSYVFTATAAISQLTFMDLSGFDSNAGWIDNIDVSPVPEPTTMIAGALLLLPFGASTLRFVRRNRTA